MDKYLKTIMAIVTIIIISNISYAILLIIGFVNTYFPFYIIFPGSIVIWIPIIARKRQQELKKREQVRYSLKR
ncbi:MAG: hypothetical protein ACFE8N_09345 [Promethearchaeota archaeon]